MFNLENKFKKKKTKYSPNLSSKETLFKHWHKILITYALCNVLFIIISIAVIFGIASWGQQRAVDTEVQSQPEVLSSDQLQRATKLLRFKDLVRQEIITLDRPEVL